MDRLTIINAALLNTGNSRINVEYDGSDEWLVCGEAWNRALRYLIPAHPWNFANTSTPLVTRLSTSPSPRFPEAYALPVDCMWVESAWVDGRPLGDFEIVDQKFCCAYASGLTIKYVRLPAPTQFPPNFVELVTMKVEEYLLRGFNEDLSAARARAADVDAYLAQIRSALDRQEPPRAILRSRSAARRRGRFVVSPLNRPPYDGVP
ncbi:hypothetical protein [Bosea sp. (in: a-proteobacteria)]|uniref:hypothetical protein n=1 Tax=Bosea sp. (in: a-proteobacteria) TaxID=1871050 RepID=UPI001AC5BF34|nr:hypothetical protein [Bosea sp. (in: a-proteobacteria)]MBN9438254.1 hypothetical protein [Bosea sp. (in: a-proteobacteria)]